MSKVLPIIALLVAAFIGGIYVGKGKGEAEVVVQRDTIITHDTLFADRPVPVYITQIRTDTVRLALIDTSNTVVVRDYASVEVPITRKVYRDSTYMAIVSGFRPQLDSIWIYNTTKEINVIRTVRIQPKHWGFGAALGPSLLVTPKGDVKGGIGLTAGLTYTF